MAKKKMKKETTILYSLLAVIVVGLLVALFSGNNQGFTINPSSSQDGEQSLSDISCPDDGDTTVTLNIQNPLNTTASETFDAEVTFDGDSGERTTGTDSTDGSYTLNCGTEYTLIVESADGAGGDNAKIVDILSSGSDASIVNDGEVQFTPSGSSYNLRVEVSQHGTVEAKAYDNQDARFAYDSGDASNTEYEGDGTIFRDGDNSTAFALSNAGDFLDFTFDVRTTAVDTEFGDLGFYIAVEAPVTQYDEPFVSFNGKTLSDVKGSALNPSESKQLSNYEYVYEVQDDSIVRKAKELDFYIEANSDASTDVEVDLVAIGKVDSINGVDILTSSAQDNSGATTVYAVQDFTIDVS